MTSISLTPHRPNSLAAAKFRKRARSRARARAGNDKDQAPHYGSILRDEAGRSEKHGPGIFGSAVSSSSCFQIFRPCDVLPEYLLRLSWVSGYDGAKPRPKSSRKPSHDFARNAEVIRTCIREKIVSEIAQVRGVGGDGGGGEREREREREREKRHTHTATDLPATPHPNPSPNQISNMHRALDKQVADATDFCYETARKGIGALQKETQRKMTLILGEELELRRRLQQLEWTEDFVNDCRAAAENDDKFLEDWADEVARLRDEFCKDQKDVVAKLHLRTGDEDDVDEDYGDDDVGLNMYFTGDCGVPSSGRGTAARGARDGAGGLDTALREHENGAGTSHKERSAALAHATYYWRGEEELRGKAFPGSAEVISRAKRAVQF